MVWLRKRRRFLTSHEKLAMMGLPVLVVDECYAHLSEREKHALAGDMYNGFSCAANFLAEFVTLGQM